MESRQDQSTCSSYKDLVSESRLRIDIVKDFTQSLTHLKWIKTIKLLSLDLKTVKTISPGQALVIWVADLFSGSALCLVEECDLILDEMKNDIQKFGNYLFNALEERTSLSNLKIPIADLVFADRKFVTITGRQEILNIENGEWIRGLELHPFERVIYNLGVLFLRRLQIYHDNANNSPTSDR